MYNIVTLGNKLCCDLFGWMKLVKFCSHLGWLWEIWYKLHEAATVHKDFLYGQGTRARVQSIVRHLVRHWVFNVVSMRRLVIFHLLFCCALRMYRRLFFHILHVTWLPLYVHGWPHCATFSICLARSQPEFELSKCGTYKVGMWVQRPTTTGPISLFCDLVLKLIMWK